jgi:hypothetical protein
MPYPSGTCSNRLQKSPLHLLFFFVPVGFAAAAATFNAVMLYARSRCG